MWKQSVWSSSIAATLAAKHLEVIYKSVMKNLYVGIYHWKPIISHILCTSKTCFYLQKGGLLVLPGAAPATAGTPGNQNIFFANIILELMIFFNQLKKIW